MFSNQILLLNGGINMRILITNYSEVRSPGGVHKTIIEMARHLTKIGHQAIIIQANPLNLPSEEIYEGFKIIRIKSKFGDKLYGLHPELYPFLKNSILRLKPDVVHIHGYHTLFSPEIILLVKKINPTIPLVFSPHFGTLSHNTFAGKYLWNFYNQIIGKKMISLSNSICAASRYEASNLHNILKVPCEKIKIVPHGVDIIDLSHQRDKTGTINLLYAGHILKIKGIQYLIKALYILNFKIGVKTKLTIIGEGPYKLKLKKLADKLNVNQFIYWNGFLSSYELVNEFKKADIFLLTSMSENYGIIVTEALASGIPVVVTKTTALNEFLNESGCFGIDFPPDSVKLAELVLKIYSSDVQIGPFSDKVRTWDKVIVDYEKMYEKVLFLGE